MKRGTLRPPRKMNSLTVTPSVKYDFTVEIAGFDQGVSKSGVGDSYRM